MTVEETVRNCISNFPSLYAHRSDVLAFIFFVIGNGYEWENGELVNQYQLPENHSPLWDESKGEFAIEQNIKSRQILAELEERCLPSEHWKTRPIYPICEYSRIMTVPDNVQPDWLEAAWEAIDIARRTPIMDCGYPENHNSSWLDQAVKRLSKIR